MVHNCGNATCKDTQVHDQNGVFVNGTNNTLLNTPSISRMINKVQTNFLKCPLLHVSNSKYYTMSYVIPDYHLLYFLVTTRTFALEHGVC